MRAQRAPNDWSEMTAEWARENPRATLAVVQLLPEPDESDQEFVLLAVDVFVRRIIGDLWERGNPSGARFQTYWPRRSDGRTPNINFGWWDSRLNDGNIQYPEWPNVLVGWTLWDFNAGTTKNMWNKAVPVGQLSNALWEIRRQMEENPGGHRTREFLGPEV